MINLSVALDGETFEAREVQVMLTSGREEEAPTSSSLLVHVLPVDDSFAGPLYQRFLIAQEHGVPIEFGSLSYQSLVDDVPHLTVVDRLTLVAISAPFLTFTARSVQHIP